MRVRRGLAVSVAFIAVVLVACSASTPSSVATSACGGRANSLPHPQGRRHLEYVFPDRAICVYDIDRGQRLVGAASLPQASVVRGVTVDPRRARLYVSYGGDGGPNGSGSLLKYDLLRNRVVWTQSYKTGVDSMALSRNGRTIYMPTGELAKNGIWTLISARTGRAFGHIDAGAGPHNTIVGLSGEWVYLGGRNERHLVVVSTRTNAVVRQVGPLQSGVRPFTVNGRETIAYTTATGFLGFEVSDLRTGTRLYTVPIEGFNWNPDTFRGSAPSHGISLSPDEGELYVIDGPNSKVHVFDVSKVPTERPRKVATIGISELSGDERGCAYDCFRDGWLQHSRDGRFVYVGDSGDVIATKTRRVVARLPALRNSRKALEIDWRGGRPVATTTRYGLGYVRQP